MTRQSSSASTQGTAAALRAGVVRCATCGSARTTAPPLRLAPARACWAAWGPSTNAHALLASAARTAARSRARTSARNTASASLMVEAASATLGGKGRAASGCASRPAALTHAATATVSVSPRLAASATRAGRATRVRPLRRAPMTAPTRASALPACATAVLGGRGGTARRRMAPCAHLAAQDVARATLANASAILASMAAAARMRLRVPRGSVISTSPWVAMRLLLLLLLRSSCIEEDGAARCCGRGAAASTALSCRSTHSRRCRRRAAATVSAAGANASARRDSKRPTAAPRVRA